MKDTDLLMLPGLKPTLNEYGCQVYRSPTHTFLASILPSGPFQLATVSISRRDEKAITPWDRALLRRAAIALEWVDEPEDEAAKNREVARRLGMRVIPNHKFMAILPEVPDAAS